MLKLRDEFIEKFADCSEETQERLNYEKLKAFKAEIGWYIGFKGRYGLHSGVAAGEAASVDMNFATKGAEEIKEELDGLDPNDIFNLDEAALFFRMFPERTIMVQPNEKGAKRSKVNSIICFSSFSLCSTFHLFFRLGSLLFLLST